MGRLRTVIPLFSIVFSFDALADEQPGPGVTKIHAAFTLSMHRTTPRDWEGVVLNEIFLEFSGRNIVKEVYHEASKGAQRTADTKSSLGSGKWRILGPHRLQRVDRYPQNIVTVDIEVIGSTCKAQWQSTLLPGFTDHLFPSMTYHQLEHYENPRMEESICTITKGE